ncbi:hypothetical protein B4V02_06470 [Paenibacillus kribbensis]|uniref:Uncharacterized protein n=1 Tax=Paenibacillus kribbensis TaxID=172713 RepID=A0A222WJS2_9BACL|nr:hypothetical protein [Paenibacillus kribbensis]ASR46346.1 hypothetical protein B4V02_06470 [Paenibacillus kribbensis]
MKVKRITWVLAVLTVSAVAFTGIITSNVNDYSDTLRKSESVTYEPVPADVIEQLNHPDRIKTKDGLFVKTKTLQAENRFSQNEVVFDVSEATDKTKVIVAYDATYIKEEGIE